MLARKALRTSTCTESALREPSCRSRSHWCPRSGRAMITSVLIIALVAIALAYDIYVTVFDLCQRTVAPLPGDVDFTVYAKQEQDDGVEVIAWLAACLAPALPVSADRHRATTQTPQSLDATHDGALFPINKSCAASQLLR
jgi:hypothetical protein